MSLDDITPTQYFGPDAVAWVHPSGKVLSLDPVDALAADRALGRTAHRNGCSVVRTGRCTCAYLAQWDRTPEYTAPTWDLSADEAREIAKDSAP